MKKTVLLMSMLFLTMSLFACAPAEANNQANEKKESQQQNSLNETDDSQSKGMDALDAMISRKTTRAFFDTEIAAEDIKTILTAAMSAPTAGNNLANEFVVITDKAIMQQIQAVHPYADALETAPAVIVVAVDLDKAKYPENWLHDSSTAGQNILTAATALGIDSNMMSIYPQEDRILGVQKAIGLTENVMPSMMIALGYGDESKSGDVESSATQNLYDETKVHMNTYESK